MESWLDALLFRGTRFEAGSPSHLAALALPAALAVFLVALGRTGPERVANRLVRRVLGMGILLAEATFVAIYVPMGTFSVRFSLPLQLCDLTAIATGLALLTGAPALVEWSWFLGLSATLVTTLTPDLVYAFPHLEFLCFFATHSLVPAAAVYMVVGLGWRPRPGAAIRVFAAVHGLAIPVAALDRALNANYFYLCRKPGVASAFDHLGPWPTYLLALDGILVACLLALTGALAALPAPATAMTRPAARAARLRARIRGPVSAVDRHGSG